MYQYTAATMIDPPMIFPMVTGKRLPPIKLVQVKSGKSAAVFPMLFQNASGAPALMNRPMGLKYIFAMQCSKPAAANAAIGITTVMTRSMLVRALKHIHTAMQTSALHMIPSVSAGRNSREVLADAVLSAVSPTTPPPNVYCVL